MVFKYIFSSTEASLLAQSGTILFSLLLGGVLTALTQKKVHFKKISTRRTPSYFLFFLFSSLTLSLLLPISLFLLHQETHLIQLAVLSLFALSFSSLLNLVFKSRPIRYGGMVLGWLAALLHALGLLIPFLTYLKSVKFQLASVSISLLGLIKACFTTGFLVYGAMAFSTYLAKNLKKQRHIQTSTQLLISKVVTTLLIVCSVFIGLSLLGIDLSVFSIFAGALGVGVAFSLQNIFSNYFSGFVILLDRSIKPGDVISLNEGKTYGIVNKLHARYVSVRTREGKEHLIPNQEIISNKLENWSYSDPHIRMEIYFTISFDSDLPLAEELLVSIAKQTKRVKLDPAPYVRFSSLIHNAVELKLRLWVIDPENGTSGIQSDIILEAWKAFRKAGIRIPYPPREIHSTNPLETLKNISATHLE
ncbi:MAG: mechanosensitive ion channel [Chlamydiia bacterium]|nr:mechanosensitive ion channel [Chlamydiia bacterium]